MAEIAGVDRRGETHLEMRLTPSNDAEVPLERRDEPVIGEDVE